MLMFRRLLPLGAVLAAGCWPDRPLVAPPPAVAPQLPVRPRTLPVPDVAAVPGELPPLAVPGGDYHHLAAEACRALACTHAPGAQSILDAARDDDRGYLFDGGAKGETARLRRVLARRLAQEVRNRSAGAALDAYYQLLEAELLTDILTAAAAELDQLVRTGEGFRDRGFADGAELAKLRRQQTDTRRDLLRTQQAVRRLNAELKVLVGLGVAPGAVLPTDRIAVVQDALDPDAAVRLGVASRADLNGLRELDAHLGPKTVEAVRHALIGLVPVIRPVTAAAFAVTPGLAHFLPHLLKSDVAAYRELLRQALAERQLQADKDIRAAVDEWAIQQHAVAVAKTQAIADEERARELAGRAATGAAVEAEFRRAKLEAIRSRAELVREAVKWKRADVAARQAMGLLCGPDEPPAMHGPPCR
jgi:hypothetical protein